MNIMLNGLLIFLVVGFNFLILYLMYLNFKEDMEKIKNKINNKSIKKKLRNPDELSNIFENLEEDF